MLSLFLGGCCQVAEQLFYFFAGMLQLVPFSCSWCSAASSFTDTVIVVRWEAASRSTVFFHYATVESCGSWHLSRDNMQSLSADTVIVGPGPWPQGDGIARREQWFEMRRQQEHARLTSAERKTSPLPLSNT